LKINACIFTCTNGLGHIRRSILLADELNNNGVQTTIFAPKNTVIYLCKKLNLKTPYIVDFDTQTTINDWKDKTAINWIERIPDISNFKIVVSDNLIEILKIRRDAWISGSFFWHRSIKNFDRKIFLESEYLIENLEPNIISSRLFSANYFPKKNLHQVGLFFNNKVFENVKNPRNILISIGRGGHAYSKVREFIENNKFDNLPIEGKILIDPELYSNSMPNIFSEAKYNQEMYSSLLAAIIRPGIGTLTECLFNKVPLYLFYEDGNYEMKYNASQIRKNNLGYDCENISSCWKKCLKQISLSESFSLSELEVYNDFNGANEASKKILEYYK